MSRELAAVFFLGAFPSGDFAVYPLYPFSVTNLSHEHGGGLNPESI